MEANGFFTRFRELIEHHMRSEETTLFPRLAAMGQPIHRELLDVLVSEHEAIRPLVAEIQGSLDCGALPLSEVEHLLHTLAAHESKEEMFLYPMLFHLAQLDAVMDVYRKQQQSPGPRPSEDDAATAKSHEAQGGEPCAG